MISNNLQLTLVLLCRGLKSSRSQAANSLLFRSFGFGLTPERLMAQASALAPFPHNVSLVAAHVSLR